IAPNQTTIVVDVFSLHSVSRTNRQLQFIHRTSKHRFNSYFLLFRLRKSLSFQVYKLNKLLMQNSRGATNGFFRIQGTIGLHIKNQFIQVSPLLNTSTFHTVGYTANRAKRRSQLQTTNSTTFVFIMTTGISRLIAAATSNGQAHGKRRVTSNIGNHVLGIFNLDIVINLNITSGYNTWAFFGQGEYSLVFAVHNHGYTFEVKEDFNNILANTFNIA